MPVDLSPLCARMNISPGEICFHPPGGIEVCLLFPSLVPPTPDEQMKQLFAQINSVLAPMTPIFNIIDAVVQVFECAKAAATGDIQKIVECIPNLAEKVNKLLALLPYYSIPLLIVEIIDALIVYLRGQRSQLVRQKEYLERILAAQLASAQPGNIQLANIAACAIDDLTDLFQNMNEGNAPLNRLIGAINYFLHLIGVTECVPSIGAFTPNTIDPALIALDALIEFLTVLRGIIPIPTPLQVQTDTDC